MIKELFERVKRLGAADRLALTRWLLADIEPELYEPPPPVLRWPPPRPPVPTYEMLPLVYTENYYANQAAVEIRDTEEGDFTLPEGSRLLFMGYSLWSMKSGWSMHMYTVDRFPVSEQYGGPSATEHRMIFLTSAQMRVLEAELSEEHRSKLKDLLDGDVFEPREFLEVAPSP